MSRLKELERACDREYDAGYRIRQRLGDKLSRAKTRTEDALRSDEAIVGAFTAGVIADQARRSLADSKASNPKNSADSAHNAAATSASNIPWASLLIRAAIPYAIQGLTASTNASPNVDA